MSDTSTPARAWTRWQDWVEVVLGVVAVLSPLWLDTTNTVMWTMIVLGALIALDGLFSLAMPGVVYGEYVQVVDDMSGRTLAAASTREKDLGVPYGGNKTAAQAVGRAIAERLKAAGVIQVAFDRGAFQYHGRVAALADAAREAGLQF